MIMNRSKGPSSGHHSWIRRPARRHRWQARIRFFIKASFVGFGPSSFTKTFDSNSVLSQAIDLAFGIVFDIGHSSSNQSRMDSAHFILFQSAVRFENREVHRFRTSVRIESSVKNKGLFNREKGFRDCAHESVTQWCEVNLLSKHCHI